LTHSNKSKQHIREKFELVEQSSLVFFIWSVTALFEKMAEIMAHSLKDREGQIPSSISIEFIHSATVYIHMAHLNPK